ncbi:endonuclease domain-containing 1 protein-like [Morone saxatilis]|uniref:endonuclease domain-containing 1 protein-like n=1 Tax=Morone saxatilis TaxID=34816 RepID=UPI0015E2476E|nr:endonuclease domain-containing 1 protein-like [Morone saxatilis]
MVKLKTRSLWFLAAFLSLSTVPTVAEVVEDLSKCKGFLLEEFSPELPDIFKPRKKEIQNQNRYKPICQTYNNERRFLTLYDTKNKIPVFSAYKYRGEGEGGRPAGDPWMIEPQLENSKDNKNMADVEENQPYSKQASTVDYNNAKGYNKGHLFPSTHAFNQDDKISTFTLTNVAPQITAFNTGSWSNMEKCIKCLMDHNCNNEGFVVVGATPGPEQNKNLNNRVNIPSMLWSAFCCYNPKMKKWISAAHWGNNVDQSGMTIRSLGELNQQLKGKVFHDQCPLIKNEGINACGKTCKYN